MSTSNQTVMITGAAKGIGRASALALADVGYNVAVADVDTEAGETVAADVRERGIDALFVEMDVSDASAIESAVDAVIDRFGRIDVLVNNAGVQTDRPFLELSESEWDWVLDVNLKGAFLTAQRVAKAMIERDITGRIINVSSIHQSLPRRNKVHYDASKGGLKMLTKDMALELAEYRINVNAVAPGAVETPINESILEDPDQFKMINDQIPWDRFAEADEVADAIRYLGHEAPEYVTGTTLRIDGGLSLVGAE